MRKRIQRYEKQEHLRFSFESSKSSQNEHVKARTKYHSKTDVGKNISQHVVDETLNNVQVAINKYESDPQRCSQAYALSCAFLDKLNRADKVSHIVAYGERESKTNDSLSL